MKNASKHTLRNYAIDLNALKSYLGREVVKELKPENLPDKIRFEDSYDQRFKGKDGLLPFSLINKQVLRRFFAEMNRGGQSKATIVRRLSSIQRPTSVFATVRSWSFSIALVCA